MSARNQKNAEFDLQSLKEEAEKHQCVWVPNPSEASHFYGSWEWDIGLFSTIMYTSLLHVGPHTIARDELDTELDKEASSIINNTPLYQIFDDPNDPFPVSPSTLMYLKDNPNPPPIESFSEADLLAY